MNSFSFPRSFLSPLLLHRLSPLPIPAPSTFPLPLSSNVADNQLDRTPFRSTPLFPFAPRRRSHHQATRLLNALISSTAGARGWFVTLLTDPSFEPVFRPPLPAPLLDAVAAAPDPNVRLCTM